MLTKQQTDYVIQLLQEGKELPEEFKYDLFPTTQKEYELTYAGKARKEDILANEDGVFPVPLQIEKVFNTTDKETSDDDWKNMIVFGDNLQFLKTINENKDPIIKDKVKGKIKLIYIDPPFATESDFKGSQGQKAYTDKAKGADFIEFLRRRLILAREILAEDGSIYVHLDWKKAHYIKIVLDEIFGEKKFRNQIIWKYFGPTSTEKNFPRKHDVILFYTKTDNYYFDGKATLVDYDEKAIKRYDKIDEDGRRYKVYNDDNGGQRIAYLKGGKPTEVFEIPFVQGTSSERIGYPTQKPETLLERLIKASTKEGDLILDFFGGSGTTIATAEKLNRKWITCDIGKLSYFTIQKRILQISKSKDLNNPKNKYKQNAKNFMTCTLGLYDLKKALDLEWTKYQEFASGLFELELKPYKISGFEFDAKKSSYPVKMFDYKKFKDSSVDEEYLNSIHQIIGKKVSGRVYIIAPANSIDFLSDYHQIGNIRYYFLKIPYHMIKELHKTPFQKLKQPQSMKKINEVEEAIGFHFIRQPEVKTKLIDEKNEIKLSIQEFKSQYSKDEEGRYLENFETLSAIFIDKDYNDKTFEMDEVYFASDLLPKKKKKKKDNEDIRDELKSLDENSLILSLDKKDLGNKIMVVYTDIFGNDFTETFTLEG